MSDFTVAWLVICVCAAGGALILYKLMANWSKPTLRTLLIGLTLAFFLAPAPVPDYEFQLAPAFVVLIFEALFQTNGNPTVALYILLLALVTAGMLSLLATYLYKRLQSPPKE